jgi:Ion channel
VKSNQSKLASSSTERGHGTERVSRKKLGFCISVPSALLFVFLWKGVPFLSARGHETPPWVILGIGVVACAFLWMIAINYAYFALSRMYKLPPLPWLRSDGNSWSETLFPSAPVTRARCTAVGFLSYLLTAVNFALIYYGLSNASHEAFGSSLSLVSALYFSLVTIATVGYGDISPHSDWARAVVSIEIVLGVLFGVFLLSLFASYVQGVQEVKSASHRRT